MTRSSTRPAKSWSTTTEQSTPKIPTFVQQQDRNRDPTAFPLALSPRKQDISTRQQPAPRGLQFDDIYIESGKSIKPSVVLRAYYRNQASLVPAGDVLANVISIALFIIYRSRMHLAHLVGSPATLQNRPEVGVRGCQTRGVAPELHCGQEHLRGIAYASLVCCAGTDAKT